MNRSQRQRAANEVVLLLQQALMGMDGGKGYGDWFAQLDDWAKVGYPSGAGGGSSGGDTADPTFLAATGPDKMREAKRDVEKLFAELTKIANRLSRYRNFTTLTRKEAAEDRGIYCVNIACMERITKEGSDVPRCGGRCQRCGKHYERYLEDWPKKRVMDRRRAS